MPMESLSVPFGMIGARMWVALRQSSPRLGRVMFMILIAIMKTDAMPCRESKKRKKKNVSQLDLAPEAPAVKRSSSLCITNQDNDPTDHRRNLNGRTNKQRGAISFTEPFPFSRNRPTALFHVNVQRKPYYTTFQLICNPEKQGSKGRHHHHY